MENFAKLWNYIIKQNLIEVKIRFRLRLISKQIAQIIEQDDLIKPLVKTQKNLGTLLLYDRQIYDSEYYNRLIINNSIRSEYKNYKKVQLPYIEQCTSDFDDIDELAQPELISFVGFGEMPNNYYIFLAEYFRNVNVQIILYPYSLIQSATQEYKYLLQQDLKLDSLDKIFLVPICYSEHQKIHFKDEEYVNIMCYIHDMEHLETHNYIVIKLPSNINLIETLVKIYKSITGIEKFQKWLYAQNITDKAKSLESCIKDLLE
jgi:hypothetical protein